MATNCRTCKGEALEGCGPVERACDGCLRHLWSQLCCLLGRSGLAGLGCRLGSRLCCWRLCCVAAQGPPHCSTEPSHGRGSLGRGACCTRRREASRVASGACTTRVPTRGMRHPKKADIGGTHSWRAEASYTRKSKERRVIGTGARQRTVPAEESKLHVSGRRK